MKTHKMLTFLFLVLGLVLYSAEAGQGTPMGTGFTYQGQLYDANYPANGSYDFSFKLYDADSDGNKVGIDVNIGDVDVVDGYFTVELDFGGDAFDGEARWLEVDVRPGDSNDPNGYTTLSPRQEVTPTPYALHAKNANMVDGKHASDLVKVGDAAGGDLQGTYPNPTLSATAHNSFTSAIPKNIQVFTSSGTWIKPADISTVYVEVWGGGGAGGDGGSYYSDGGGGGGGGAGGYTAGLVAVSGDVTVTVGSAGGTSSFAGDTTLQATGGSDGSNSNNGPGGVGGSGGVGSNGTINLTGATGNGGGSDLRACGGMGGGAYGGGGGAGSPYSYGADGAPGQCPGGGGGGGGGGGSQTVGPGNGSGSGGGAGMVIVYY